MAFDECYEVLLVAGVVLFARNTFVEGIALLDIDQVMELLPHRYPFLMVDRVLELEAGNRAVVLKNVSVNEPFFQGHYPGMPVMPGVMIIEAMAQAGGIAAGSEAKDQVPLFTGINKAKFRKVVRPGDQLRIEAVVLASRMQMVRVKAVAKVDGKVAAEGELMFALSQKGAVGNHAGRS